LTLELNVRKLVIDQDSQVIKKTKTIRQLNCAYTEILSDQEYNTTYFGNKYYT